MARPLKELPTSQLAREHSAIASSFGIAKSIPASVSAGGRGSALLDEPVLRDQQPTTTSSAPFLASLSTPPSSRPQSPLGRDSPARSSSSYGVRGEGARGQTSSDLLSLIIRSFAPRVAIYASSDTDELAAEKGFSDGLWRLLRPFGDHVHGNVTIRDSNGYNRTYGDFGVRFYRYGDDISQIEALPPAVRDPATKIVNMDSASVLWGQRELSGLENLSARYLYGAEPAADRTGHGDDERGVTISAAAQPLSTGNDAPEASTHYTQYLRSLLGGQPFAPQETFAHPVACVVAVSSRSENPIAEFRRLYEDTTDFKAGGHRALPSWVDDEYLRYYVLVHDEERDDISRSMSFFDQMKRHFGLHCHMLRIRSTRSAQSDDDGVPLPRAQMLSATEQLAMIEARESRVSQEENSLFAVDVSEVEFVFESDVVALRTFVREMVTQSLVPTMERNISIWNDQVVSRRRGLTGRFISLSRKWTGLGPGPRSSAMNALGIAGSPVPYDAHGFYQAQSPEAITRKLADYAFMLRDWKLASSTYDLLRSDFGDAKAWKYHAAANEMAAFSLILLSTTTHPSSSATQRPKIRVDLIDQMLEASFYSYKARCGQSFGALRALLVGLELLHSRGGICIDHAIKLGMLLLESRVLGPIGDALVKDRLSGFCVCELRARRGALTTWSGARRRKSGLWAIMATEAWMRQGNYVQASHSLKHAHWAYNISSLRNDDTSLWSATLLISGLQRKIVDHLGSDQETSLNLEQHDGLDEEREALG